MPRSAATWVSTSSGLAEAGRGALRLRAQAAVRPRVADGERRLHDHQGRLCARCWRSARPPRRTGRGPAAGRDARRRSRRASPSLSVRGSRTLGIACRDMRAEPSAIPKGHEIGMTFLGFARLHRSAQGRASPRHSRLEELGVTPKTHHRRQPPGRGAVVSAQIGLRRMR